MDVLLLVLSILAIVLSTGAIMFGVLFYHMQTRQGERIAISVMSTVDQIYRRMTGPGMFEEDYGVDPDMVDVHLSRTFLRRNEDTVLLVEAKFWQPLTGVAEIEVVVERPSGRRDSVARTLADDGDLRLTYPSESFDGSTSEPGRYHIAWRAADSYELVTPSTGAREHRAEPLGSGSTSFYVLP